MKKNKLNIIIPTYDDIAYTKEKKRLAVKNGTDIITPTAPTYNKEIIFRAKLYY